MKRKGFTLIELLVVIAIIALLMAILMPALEKVRQQAQKVICVSNMRQWGTIIYLYLQDNNWVLPPEVGGNNWLSRSAPYVQNEEIRLCPRATQTIAEGARQPFAANDSQRPPYKGSYGFHDYVTSNAPDRIDPPDPKKWETSEVREASRVPVIAGCVRLYLVNPEPISEPPAYEGDVAEWESHAGGSEMINYCVNRHNGYVCGAFLDFSARPIGLKELWVLKWHRLWDVEDVLLPAWPYWMTGFKEYPQ